MLKYMTAVKVHISGRKKIYKVVSSNKQEGDIMNKVYVTWDQVKMYIDDLKDIVEGKEYKGIYTFPRGGLVLATLLSYKTGLPLLLAPCDNCIIIDDICDTGITMKRYSDLKDVRGYFITAMFIQDDQLEGRALYQCDLDYFDRIKYQDWVVYGYKLW